MIEVIHYFASSIHSINIHYSTRIGSLTCLKRYGHKLRTCCLSKIVALTMIQNNSNPIYLMYILIAHDEDEGKSVVCIYCLS